MRRNRANKCLFAFVAVCCLLLSSCYTRVEGCLDADAVNFSARADDNCCCTYPRLVLKYSHVLQFDNDTITLNYNIPYAFEVDQLITFSDIRFYVSNVHLVKSDGTEVGVENRIDLETQVGDIFEVEDNFSIVNKNVFVDTIGEFRNEGLFDSLKFYVGIPTPANNAYPDSLVEGHPLGLFPDTLWNENTGYIFNRIKLLKDTIEDTSLTTYEIDGTTNLVEVSLPINLNAETGRHAEIVVQIDYAAWLKGIDFEATDMVVIEKIVENTTNAFSVLE